MEEFILFNQKALDEETFKEWFKKNSVEWENRKNQFKRDSTEFLNDLDKMSQFQAEIRFNKIYSDLFNIPAIDYVIVANYVNENNDYDESMLFSTIIKPNEDDKSLRITKGQILKLIEKTQKAKNIQEKIRNHYQSFLNYIQENITDKQEAKDLFIQLYYEHKKMYRTLKKNKQQIYNSTYYDLFYSRQKSSGKQIEAYMLHLVEKHLKQKLNSPLEIESGDFYSLLENLNKEFKDEQTGYYHIQSIIIRSLNSRAGSISGDIVLLNSKGDILLNFQLKSAAKDRTISFAEDLKKSLKKLENSLSDYSKMFKLYSDSYSQQLTLNEAKEIEKKVVNNWEEKFNKKINESKTFADLVTRVVGS